MITKNIFWPWKIVGPPIAPTVLTITMDKSNYSLGEVAGTTGTLTQNGVPVQMKDVGMSVIPPAGDVYELIATTGVNGVFQTTWNVIEPYGNWVIAATYPSAETVDCPFIHGADMSSSPN